MITVQEDFSPEYANRTEVNASQAAATVAIAIDFNSAGEKLTKKLVLKHGRVYIPLAPLATGPTEEQVMQVVTALNAIPEKYCGSIKMSEKHVDAMFEGRKSITSRTESYHSLFYKGDGLYRNGDFNFKDDKPTRYSNTVFFVRLLGKKHVNDFNAKQMAILAKKEGFSSLGDMEANCRPETFAWLKGEQYKYFYDIHVANGNEITLNIAGNGIYTMKGVLTQKQCDDFVTDLLTKVINNPLLKKRIAAVRTGGQTGFDEAGAKAAMALGIPTTVLMPRGYRIRTMDGDITMDKTQATARFTQSHK